MNTKRSGVRSFKKRLDGVTMPISRKRTKWGRNMPCLCGSDKKYKNCCNGQIDDLTVSDGNAKIETLSDDIQKMIDIHREMNNYVG